jgi:aldehyde:ferredoxin oxidoreductase
MGSKNLKAVVAAGKKKIPLAEPEAFREFSRRWVKLLQAHTSTGEILPRYGTANFVRKMNDAGILPTRNYQRGKFEEADRISGEYLAEKHLVRNSGCPGCPIRCERRVMLGDKEVKGPEYETLGMLGSNLENSDLEMIKAWNHQADLLGLDTISLGSVLGFAMELQERGIKDFGLRFGETAGIAEVINKITYREGEYSDLADGVKALADKYGGREFAIHSKGLELAAYDPRKAVGMGLGYATANRGGCHLNGGYLVFLEALGPLFIDALTDKGKPALAVLFQNGMEAISAAGSCLFTSFTLVPELIYKMNPGGAALKLLGKSMIGSRFLLERTGGLLPYLLPFNSLYLFPHAQAVRLATGIKMTTGKFLQLGERSFNMERVFNIREGINGTEDSLPRRLTDEAMDPARSDSKVDLSAMLPLYYKIRGWDKAGQPTTNKLRQLQIVV